MTILSLRNIRKSYNQGGETVRILNDVSLDLQPGEIMSLTGPSGCGKSSLLHLAGLLDRADSGEIIINGQNCSSLSDRDKSLIRANKIGFVYQFHHLLPEFTSLENLIIPQLIIGKRESEAKNVAEKFLDLMKLSSKRNVLPRNLSGGERQRVAIARSLVNNPDLILADEPTGNLDPQISEMVFELLLYIVEENNIACLVVTHNEDLARKAAIKMTIKDGNIIGGR